MAIAATVALAATPFVARMAPFGLSRDNADAAAALAAAPATSVLETAAKAVAGTGRHLGFDTHSYPGDRAMRAWRVSDANYEWVGYYLPAPCHKDDSWSGTRERLADMGWGVAVIYVGQQTWTDPAHRKYRMTKAQMADAERRGATCLPSFVSGDRGRAEADDAVARTADEGFPVGTVIYLDLERMEIVPPSMRDYYREWVARVLEDGRFVPGVYVHTHNAKVVYRDVRAQYAAAGIDADPPFWVAGGSGFNRDRAPADVGHTFAHAWQGVLDIVEKRNGFKMPIDVNVASVPSPSGVIAIVE